MSTRRKKLEVRRETLRIVSAPALRGVAGGSDNAAPEPKSNAWTGGNDDGGRDYSCQGG